MVYNFFSFLWVLGVISFFLAIIEWVGVHSFIRPLYSIGIKVFSQCDNISALPDAVLASGRVRVGCGEYKFLNTKECLFTPSVISSRLSSMGTPFPLKGTITWTDKGAESIGRLPVGTLFFMGTVLVVWSYCAAVVGDWVGLIMIWLIALAIVLASIIVERKRMSVMVREFLSYMSRPSAGMTDK